MMDGTVPPQGLETRALVGDGKFPTRANWHVPESVQAVGCPTSTRQSRRFHRGPPHLEKWDRRKNPFRVVE